MAMKKNRKVALTKPDKLNGKCISIGLGGLVHGTVQKNFKQVEFLVLLIKQVFKNKGGCVGVLYLISSNLNPAYKQITTICQIRWKTEWFHKSVKHNTSFAKVPTKTVPTKLSYSYAAIITLVKWERLKFRTGSNRFVLKSKIYPASLRAGFMGMDKLSTI